MELGETDFRREIADADAKLARYRAALEAGTEPALVAAWTAEIPATKAVYRQLGLKLTYQPDPKHVIAEARPSAITYDTECPRIDTNRNPTPSVAGRNRIVAAQVPRIAGCAA